MTPFASNLPRRYPGLKPFDRAQSAVFYGRREDAVRLTNLIVQQRLVVLFAKSGIGKTSILQAGVAPSLEQQSFAPIFIRLDKTNAPLVDTVGEILEKSPLTGGRDATGEHTGDRETLWERMKRLEFDLDGLPATPVLVFDQFEEVFTLGHSEASRRRFLAELADLANGVMPEVIRTNLLERFQRNDPTLTAEIMRWWESQPDMRVVISIRSDFLHLLDDISPLIPGILHNRYQLQPLNRKQAEEAIASPAIAPGEFYASKPFHFRSETLGQIIDFLAGRDGQEAQQAVDDLLFFKKQDEIESFNLQILCQFIEEKIIEENRSAGFEVTPEFYGGLEGLEHEIKDFYQKQLQALPDAYFKKTGKKFEKPEETIAIAQRLIEESLVTPNDRRCSMVDDYLIAAFPGMTQEILDALVDLRILRKENRLNDFYYEISHDTLLPAVVESRNRRRRQEKAEQDRLEYEAKLAEEAKRREAMEAELSAIRRQRRLARQVAISSLLTLLVMVGFGIWFVRDYFKSARKQLEEAKVGVEEEQYGRAIFTYQELLKHPNRVWVLKHTRPSIDVRKELEIVQRFDSLYQLVEKTIGRGDSLFFSDNYVTALDAYHRAKNVQEQYDSLNQKNLLENDTLKTLRVKESRMSAKFEVIDFKIENAQKTLTREFKIRQRNFEVFSEAKVWGQAVHNLERMKELLPKQQEHLDELRHELNLEEDPREYVKRELERCERELGKL